MAQLRMMIMDDAEISQHFSGLENKYFLKIGEILGRNGNTQNNRSEKVYISCVLVDSLRQEKMCIRDSVITVYILGVLVVAAVTSSRWYSTAASLTSVLLFNYIFTEPMFVLKAEDAGTQLTLLITFLAAVFTST